MQFPGDLFQPVPCQHRGFREATLVEPPQAVELLEHEVEVHVSALRSLGSGKTAAAGGNSGRGQHLSGQGDYLEGMAQGDAPVELLHQAQQLLVLDPAHQPVGGTKEGVEGAEEEGGLPVQMGLAPSWKASTA